jgi:hypothetical protein
MEGQTVGVAGVVQQMPPVTHSGSMPMMQLPWAVPGAVVDATPVEDGRCGGDNRIPGSRRLADDEDAIDMELHVLHSNIY